MRISCFVAALGVLTACSSNDSQPPPAADAGDAAPPPPPCTAVTRSATDPFAVEHAPASAEIALAKSIADRWMDVHPAEGLEWNWTDAVLATALVDLSRVTADQKYRDYLQRWIDHHVKEGYYITTSDRCLPAVAANELYRTTCKTEYRTVNETVLKYLYEEARRTDDGGINHLGVSTIFQPTLWVDSLYMFGEVLIRWGEAEKDTRALDEFSKQYGIFAGHLQDPSGWFVHGYQWGEPQDPNVFWARGNGWVLAAGYDYLRVRNDDAVKASLAKLSAAVVAAQDPTTGLYWTVVNRPGETYLETSATALFATGLARGRRIGALDASVVPIVTKAIAGIQTKITNDDKGRPVVTGTSGPTNVGGFDDYAKVPLVDDLPYGVGAVILALIESSGLQ